MVRTNALTYLLSNDGNFIKFACNTFVCMAMGIRCYLNAPVAPFTDMD